MFKLIIQILQKEKRRQIKAVSKSDDNWKLMAVRLRLIEHIDNTINELNKILKIWKNEL